MARRRSDIRPRNQLPPGIPALMMIGQFDEFGKIGRDEKIKVAALHWMAADRRLALPDILEIALQDESPRVRELAHRIAASTMGE